MEHEIVLYSNNCPRCIVVKSKLQEKNIEYTEENNMDEIMSVAEEHLFNRLPFVKVGENWYQGADAVEWVGEVLNE